MIRFVLKLSERNAIAGYDREALVTVDADVPSLESLLKRGGHGENGFEIWQLLGAEVVDHLTATTAPEARCNTCDGAGDVHRTDGEWLGSCHCANGEQAK